MRRIALNRSTSAGGKLGDFADAVYWIMKSRVSTRGDQLTVHQINSHLDKIATKYDPRKCFVDSKIFFL